MLIQFSILFPCQLYDMEVTLILYFLLPGDRCLSYIYMQKVYTYLYIYNADIIVTTCYGIT